MDDHLFVRGSPLLTAEELLALEAIGKTIERPAGDTLIGRDDEITDFALLVQKGHVKVVVGKPARIVAIRGSGEIVGEMGAIRKQPRSASVIALDDVRVLHLPATEWLSFLYDHPRAMHAQLVAADERLEQATRKIVESVLLVEQRLAKALIELVEMGICERTDEGIVLRFAQQDLASLTGAKIDSVKKAISEFKVAGLVDTGWRALIIVDLAVMREFAGRDRTAM